MEIAPKTTTIINHYYWWLTIITRDLIPIKPPLSPQRIPGRHRWNRSGIRGSFFDPRSSGRSRRLQVRLDELVVDTSQIGILRSREAQAMGGLRGPGHGRPRPWASHESPGGSIMQRGIPRNQLLGWWTRELAPGSSIKRLVYYSKWLVYDKKWLVYHY